MIRRRLQVVDETTLREARQRRDLLRRLALGEMENLYHQIAGSNFMIAFAAPDGLLLDTITDQSFSDTASATSIRPGTLWGEARCGTNALGTVAHTASPIMVHGAEHFFARHGGLTCTAAPVFDAEGTLAGVLDASSDCRSRQSHTRALVSMAATQIENGLFRECHRTDVLIALHSRAEYLHTLSAGLLAVDPGGHGAGGQYASAVAAAGPAGDCADAAWRSCFGHGSMTCWWQAATTKPCGWRIGSAASSPPSSRTCGWYARSAHRRIAVVSQPAPRPPFVAEDPAAAAAVRHARDRRPPQAARSCCAGRRARARNNSPATRTRPAGGKGAFVPVNCAALPDSLAEAETVRPFRGRIHRRPAQGAPGLVLEADGGTLFLDEIGEMKLPLQAMLLRLLDDWTVRPVGGGKRRQADVLLVAATNVDLTAAITAGRFRADLFYRLNTVEVMLPPLRAREDFAAIARHLLGIISPDWHIDDAAIAALRRLPWPGNIRELHSVLTRMTLGDPGGIINTDAVGATGRRVNEPAAQPPLREMLHDRIRAVYHETAGNISETARRLRVSRNTVYRALPKEDL